MGSGNWGFGEAGAFDRDEDGRFLLSDLDRTSGDDRVGTALSVGVELWDTTGGEIIEVGELVVD
jgi:hypothetical protein